MSVTNPKIAMLKPPINSLLQANNTKPSRTNHGKAFGLFSTIADHPSPKSSEPNITAKMRVMTLIINNEYRAIPRKRLANLIFLETIISNQM